jgi:PKD repeat protein
MKHFIISVLALSIFLAACNKYDPQLGDPPTSNDALFTYQVSDTSDNVLVFTANNKNILATWDFGNGTKASGTSVTVPYPFAGTYTVRLDVFNKGGSRYSSQDVTINQTDFGLVNNPLWNALTGGVNGPGFKVWYIDSTVTGHMGVGPNPSETPIWWQAGPLEKACAGMYNDRYIFYLSNFQFDMMANGELFINDAHAANFPLGYSSCGDWISPFSDQVGESWNLVEEEDIMLNLSGNASMGFFTGVHSYKVLELTDSTMSIQFEDTEEPGLVWYHKLRAE